jgi:hypothetical protein
LSVWLVLAGLALVGLGFDAGRRDHAESARRAADARSRKLAHHTHRRARAHLRSRPVVAASAIAWTTLVSVPVLLVVSVIV